MSTNAYIIKAGSAVPDGGLPRLLDEFEMRVEELNIADRHDAVIPLLKEREPGLAFLPPLWEDLFCVKVINDIMTIPTPFETLIVGNQPIVPNLVAAYNAGLSAFIETPIHNDLFRQTVHRARTRLARKIADMQNLKRLTEYEAGNSSCVFSPQLAERDQYLAHAFMDLINRSGPLLAGNIRILLVSSSTAQQQRFGAFLKTIGITAVPAHAMSDAITLLKNEDHFPIVISDYLLPDGDAITLVNEMRKFLTSAMPRFLVVTASPDKAAELLKPDTHIDDVIIKPGPGARIESILPAIIASIYQAS